jgi:hypothetical protein
MPGDFTKAISTQLAARWAATSAPALVFWIGGLLAWIAGHGGTGELATVTDWLNRQTSPVQVAAIVSALLGVTASAIVVERITTPVLRLLEGYWPAWCDGLRDRLVKRVRKRAEADDARWGELAAKVDPLDAAAPADLAAYARLDRALRRLPSPRNRLMPTRIGNVLRAAETLPASKYGLEAVAVWPSLWLVLPEATRQELAAARARLDGSVAAVIWGVCFCVFAVWTALAVPAGLLFAFAAVRFWVPARAESYGDLVEAAYDVHRGALYATLRWPLPASPHQERALGERLSEYLWRGSDDRSPRFTQDG